MSIKVEIWSDIACPFCYLGKRRLESALNRFEHRDQVEIQWRSFELNSSIPKGKTSSVLEFLMAHKNIPQSQAKSIFQNMTQTAAKEGLKFNFDKALHGNTFDGHRLIHFAGQNGKGNEMKERLLSGYFERGESVANIDTLVSMASEVGLDASKVKTMLESDALGEVVRTDEERARKLGISGVPFFLINGKHQLSGAQSSDTILQALQKAWSDK